MRSSGHPGSKWPDTQRADISHVSLLTLPPFTGTAQWTYTSGKPRNFLRQVHMYQRCCRQVLWQLCALEREALWQRLIQSVQLMWKRQDSCLMPNHYGVRPEGHWRIRPLWNLMSLVCLCNTKQAWDCWGCCSQPSEWTTAATNRYIKD